MRRIALAALLLAGCYGDSPRATVENEPTRADPPAQIDVTPPATNTAVMNPTVPVMKDIPERRAGGVASTDQGVHLIEYAVRMPQVLPAGKQSFHVANAGKEIHSFAIEGNGVHAELPAELSRGNAAHFEVDLPPGTYTAYCPVNGHRAKGMETKITVK